MLKYLTTWCLAYAKHRNAAWCLKISGSQFRMNFISLIIELPFRNLKNKYCEALVFKSVLVLVLLGHAGRWSFENPFGEES